MKPSFRIFFLVLVSLTVLCVVTIPAVSLASTAVHYTGTCYGFTDGAWLCPWVEFVSIQTLYMFSFSLPLLILLVIGWALTVFFWALSRTREGLSARVQSALDWLAVLLLELIAFVFFSYAAMLGFSLLFTFFPD
jgi:hypothetical protein